MTTPRPADGQVTRRCSLPLCVCGLLIASELAGSAARAQVQDAAEPAISESSDLSSALPPGEWSRVETSVDKALQWLASRQADDGSFPSDDIAQPAVTSMAVMAFLSRGHTPGQGPYGSHLSRGIDFVLSTQRRPG